MVGRSRRPFVRLLDEATVTPIVLPDDIKRKMTLFVDASYCDRTGAGGWGSWAKRYGWDSGRFQGGPVRLKDYRLSSSTTAEIAGIALALWEHKSKGDLEGLDEIMIQCDNLAALSFIYQKVPNAVTFGVNGMSDHRIAGNHKPNSPVVAKIMVTVAEMLEGLSVKVRHVKAHSRKQDNRSWVNNRCDEEAKRHMLALRKEIDDLERYGYSRPQLPL